MPLNENDNRNYSQYLNSKLWDKLVYGFTQTGITKDVWSPGGDNFENVWPVLNHVIKQQASIKNNTKYRACDFGCGTGNFAQQLQNSNFSTFACDISPKMIDYARTATSDEIVYEVGNVDSVQKKLPFDLITAIMVFQFVDDVENTIRILAESLNEDGILFFAIHHIDYAYECFQYNVKFRDLIKTKETLCGQILIGDSWIDTYIRSPDWYDNFLSKCGLDRVNYKLREKHAPSQMGIDENVEWHSSKYYIAWYKKRKK